MFLVPFLESKSWRSRVWEMNMNWPHLESSGIVYPKMEYGQSINICADFQSLQKYTRNR